MESSVFKCHPMILGTISELQTRGFTHDFTWLEGKLFCSQLKCFLTNEDFEVIEMHSFDNTIRTSRDTVLYAIESSVGCVKGILLESLSGKENVLGCKLKRFWRSK